DAACDDPRDLRADDRHTFVLDSKRISLIYKTRVIGRCRAFLSFYVFRVDDLAGYRRTVYVYVQRRKEHADDLTGVVRVDPRDLAVSRGNDQSVAFGCHAVRV